MLDTITDEHGNSATMASLGDPYYSIDEDVTAAYLRRNKRTGSDFTTLVWLDFSPGLFIEGTYGSLNKFSPSLSTESDLMGLFSPSVLFETTALSAMHSPYGGAETDRELSLGLEPSGHAETDYGMLLGVPEPLIAVGSWGGYLKYGVTVAHPDYKFAAGEIITGATSGATAVVTSYTWDGVVGDVLVRHVRGIFQDAEVITGETIGDAIVSGVLHS